MSESKKIMIVEAKLSKNPVKTEEKFKISLSIKEISCEPMGYKIPFNLGSRKGNLAGNKA